jgi:hypothetical protein
MCLKIYKTAVSFWLLYKGRKYKEYHSVCPLVRIGTLPSPNPSLASECAPPPEPGGGGVGRHTRLRGGEGLGESQFRRLEKKLSTLPTLWLLTAQLPRPDVVGSGGGEGGELGMFCPHLSLTHPPHR